MRLVEDGSRDLVDMLRIADRIDLDDLALDDCEVSRSSWSIRHIVSSRGVIEGDPPNTTNVTQGGNHGALAA